MATEYSRNRILDRIWSPLSSPQMVGLGLLALAFFEALRHWQESDETVLLVRVTTVFVLCAGVASLAEALRPLPKTVAALRSRGFVGAWWFPFFAEEQQKPLKEGRARWWVSLSLYTLVVFALPGAILASSVQHQSHGELVLIPGQGAESFVEIYPERGLRRSMGVKLELMAANMDGPTPVAQIRATDMTTMNATDLSLRSADAQRVRGILVAIRELRPLGGLGAVDLRLIGDHGEETVTLRRNAEVELQDGSRLQWAESSSNRLGTLGPAVQIAHLRGDEMVERRWVYLNFPDLNHVAGVTGLSYAIQDVQRPLSVLLSVSELGAAFWGLMGAVIFGCALLLLLLLRLLPASRLGREGDYVILDSSGDAEAVAMRLAPHVVEAGEARWVQPVSEEDFK